MKIKFILACPLCKHPVPVTSKTLRDLKKNECIFVCSEKCLFNFTHNIQSWFDEETLVIHICTGIRRFVMKPSQDFIVLYCKGLCGKFLKFTREAYDKFKSENKLHDFTCQTCWAQAEKMVTSPIEDGK